MSRWSRSATKTTVRVNVHAGRLLQRMHVVTAPLTSTDRMIINRNWIASERRIVLLTVFDKTRMREIREIDRARRVLRRCIAAEHTVDDDGEE